MKYEQATLQSQREVMKNYLKMKMDEEDWHGVQDAASDLRDIDSMLQVLRSTTDVGIAWANGIQSGVIKVK